MSKHHSTAWHWLVLSVLIAPIVLFSCALKEAGSDRGIEEDDLNTEGIAFSWMAQSALEEGKIADTLILAYSWHSEQPESWIPLDFIGDLYFCLGESIAAKLNYQLAIILAEREGDSVILFEKKIQAIDGNEEAVALVNQFLTCPESLIEPDI